MAVDGKPATGYPEDKETAAQNECGNRLFLDFVRLDQQFLGDQIRPGRHFEKPANAERANADGSIISARRAAAVASCPWTVAG